MTFTAEEKRKEALREVQMRKEVYARSGMDTLKQRRIDLMQEIADDYAKLAETERLL